jgi:hypothetical protein
MLTCRALQLATFFNHCSLAAADPLLSLMLGRLPTFPLRIKFLYRTLQRQQHQLSNGCKTSCDILSQGKKTSILKNKSYKIEK